MSSATASNADGRRAQPRISVIIPCFNDGETIHETVHSIQEDEPVELVIVDDGSSDPHTAEVLSRLEADGHRVIRHATNRGVSAARMTALEATTARYVFPLDSDDLANPGRLAEMADLLDADAGADVAYGDYLEWGERILLRRVPEVIDPYRVAYANEYPPAAMFRRESLVELGGWRPVWGGIDSRSDWSLWVAHAEAGKRGIHIGAGRIVYFYRLHGRRLQERGRVHHSEIYGALRKRHPGVFEHLSEHRKASSLSPLRRRMYPVLYGKRKLRTRRLEAFVKDLFDNLGIWTLKAELSDSEIEALQAKIEEIRGLTDAKAAVVGLGSDGASSNGGPTGADSAEQDPNPQTRVSVRPDGGSV